jgi:hypothetical protein
VVGVGCVTSVGIGVSVAVAVGGAGVSASRCITPRAQAVNDKSAKEHRTSLYI